MDTNLSQAANEASTVAQNSVDPLTDFEEEDPAEGQDEPPNSSDDESPLNPAVYRRRSGLPDFDLSDKYSQLAQGYSSLSNPLQSSVPYTPPVIREFVQKPRLFRKPPIWAEVGRHLCDFVKMLT